MVDVEKKSKEELEFDIELEKREKKILLICSAICCVLGLIVAVVHGITGVFQGDDFFFGIWFGTGIGGAIGYIRGVPHAFKETMKKEGFIESLKTTLFGILIWVFIFSILGLVGLLVRILRMNFRIKKFEKQLNALG